MTKKYKATDEKFIETVKKCFSIRQVFAELEMCGYGDSYRVFHKRVKRLNLDTSHFTGQLWSKGKKLGEKYDIKEYLDNKRRAGSNHLKKRLLKEKIFEYKCIVCQLTDWQNLPIPLELDHIDGNRDDNSLSNLRLLCANCHAQTSTYCRPKKPKGKQKVEIVKNEKVTKQYEQKTCPNCNEKMHFNSKKCKPCTNLFRTNKRTKISWPPLDELEQMVKESSYLQTGKKLGVSDNSVRKHIQRLKKNLPLIKMENP